MKSVIGFHNKQIDRNQYKYSPFKQNKLQLID